MDAITLLYTITLDANIKVANPIVVGNVRGNGLNVSSRYYTIPKQVNVVMKFKNHPDSSILVKSFRAGLVEYLRRVCKITDCSIVIYSPTCQEVPFPGEPRDY